MIKVSKMSKVTNWWLSLSVEQRAEIYMNENPEATDGDWAEWYFHLTKKERRKLYEENIADTSNEGIKGGK
jgi:hypothetical protein